MRLLVISDVHANAGALRTVLEHAALRGWDEVLFLGDAVGYGDEAGESLELLRDLPLRAGLRGNHEAMLDELRSRGRVRAGREIVASLALALDQLGPDDLRFLDSLAEVHLDDSWGAVHGALREPFEYLISVPAVRGNERYMERDIYFVGHTHVPTAFLLDPGAGSWRVRPFTAVESRQVVPPGGKAFLNPGSVSLPRDRIPGYSYGIFDEETREFTSYRLSPRPE